MFDYYNFDTEVPDVDITRLREDFSKIFEANSIEVELIKQDVGELVDENADFFGTKTPSKIFRKRIKLFITASSTDSFRREQAGIVTNDSIFQAFAKHDILINNNDLIKFLRTTKIKDFNIKKGELFTITNHNRPFYKGQFIFQELDLKRVDKE